MENPKSKFALLGILAFIGFGMVAVAYFADTADIFSRLGDDGQGQMKGTAIIVQAVPDNSSMNTTQMNMRIQQDGQVIQNVNMPITQSQVQQMRGQLPQGSNMGHQQRTTGIQGNDAQGDIFFKIDIPMYVDIGDLGDMNPESMGRGDILFCENGATLVVLSAKGMGGAQLEALYLDFGLSRCERYGTGKIRADDEIISILENDDLSTREKQFAIWYLGGLDMLSLNVTWQNNAGDGGGFEDAIGRIQAMTKNRTQTLRDVVEASNVKIEFESEGYSRTQLSLSENKKTQSILIERGSALKNHNENNQNIALGEAILVYLPHKKSKTFFVRSYCINQNRGSPGKEDKLTTWKNVPKNVQEVIDSNYVKGQVSNSAGQADVWSETG